MLGDLDIVGLICRLILSSESIEDEIYEEALLVAIACLLGGNASIQQKFLDFM